MTRARDIANFGDGIATADIDDGAVTAAKIGSLPAGSVLQVVQGTTSTRVDISSTSYVDSGLSASITPSSSSSKILVLVNQVARVEPAGTFTVVRSRIVRDSTGVYAQLTGSDASNYDAIQLGMSYLDSPSTTSSVTYKTQGYAADGSPLVADPLVYQYVSGSSSIILMEIAG